MIWDVGHSFLSGVVTADFAMSALKVLRECVDDYPLYFIRELEDGRQIPYCEKFPTNYNYKIIPSISYGKIKKPEITNLCGIKLAYPYWTPFGFSYYD